MTVLCRVWGLGGDRAVSHKCMEVCDAAMQGLPVLTLEGRAGD